jgi:hypothetical protein
LEGYWGKQGDSERIRGVEIEKERWNHAADHLCARDPCQGALGRSFVGLKDLSMFAGLLLA